MQSITLRRVVRTVLLALSLGPMLASGAATAATRPPPPPAPAWQPCPFDATAQCATVSVPVDWSRPHGARIDLALTKRPATDPAHRVGSLLINPGGPGASGVVFALLADGFFSPEIRSRFDIVGFDPRGVALSSPVRCAFELFEAEPSPWLTSQADFDRLVDYNRRLREDCRARTGPLFDHVDTGSVIRDMDAIRAALGEQKLTYFGGSYGTLLGQQYAQRFPHRVRALVLDSNVDHSLGTRAYFDSAAAGLQAAFDRFVAWCDETPSCALHGRDVRAVMAGLMARADRGELRDPADPSSVVTTLDALSYISDAFYGPEWSRIAREMAAAADAPLSPSPRAAAAIGAGTSRWTGTHRSLEASPDVEPDPTPIGIRADRAIFCEDWSLPIRDFREYQALLRSSARLAPDVRYSPVALRLAVQCIGAPPPPNPQHRLHVAGSAPVVLVNSRYDPATVYPWAVSVERQLGRSGVLVTYEGSGHGSYGRSPCITAVVDAYLISLQVPARGIRCPDLGDFTPGGLSPGGLSPGR